MALTAGTRLGQYEILSTLGAGGMGEVFRARDVKLNRDVAVKVLLPAVANDPDRLARFRREAQVLASLNHQNIAHIHGFEDAGEHWALVMELVEGPTLADRIERGAVPVEEALAIAKQIADALETAHEQAIIHRDLKPANVKVRMDGTVKVLDFGLAKALEQGAATSAPGWAGRVPELPTITAAMSGTGIIVGTAAYMSPEQAKGKPVDKRADLWSFGCVFFEMLTGNRPFEGETISDVLAKIIEREPDWTALPAKTPQSIRTLLRRCLEKDPRRRLDSAAVARLEIDDALTAPATSGLSPSAVNRGTQSRWPPWATVAASVFAAGIGAFATWTVTRPSETAPAPASRFTITLPPALPIAYSINDRDIALSADGTQLAYTAGDQSQLMVRALDRLDAVPLTGIANARGPFLSPDGRWIGFFDQLDEGLTTGPVVQRGTLKKVSTSGGPPIAISAVKGVSRGASWGSDDSIVFATSDPSTGLLRVPASGGEPEVLTKPDSSRGEFDHYFPSVLPGGRGVLFTITAGTVADRQIVVLDLKTGKRKTLIRSGSQAEYVETGHLIYTDGGALWAVRFDLARLAVLGDPVPLIEQVLTLGAVDFAISRRGTLVYVPVSGGSFRSLIWVNRQGVEEPIPAPPRRYVSARLSPDGTRVALQILDQSHEIWTWDLGRRQLTRLTFGARGSSAPLWTPDGRHIIFGSPRDTPNVSNLFRQAADGTGPEERLTTSAHQQRAKAISPDGTRMVFEELTPSAGYDFILLSLKGTPRVEPLLQTPFDERNAEISPDGRWMAYESNESGQNQIYIRPFPNVADARYQISSGGGRTSAWAPSGRELFFVSRTSIMAVPVQLTPTFRAGSPTKLFDARSILLDGRFIATGTHRTYDVSRDGQRFLMIKENALANEGAALPASMIVVQNWFEELKAKIP
jgi:eukaryotic-like serine/threonine-protein kinase